MKTTLVSLLLSLFIVSISMAESMDSQSCRTKITADLEYTNIKISKFSLIEHALEDATLSSQMTCCTTVKSLAFTHLTPLKNQAIEELKAHYKVTDTEAENAPIKFTIEGCKYSL